MDLPRTFSHPSLVRGALVEIFVGNARVWVGVLTEPDVDDDWTFNALGLSALGKDYPCFDGSLNSTSKPDTAIDQAISLGLPWKRPTSLSSAAFASNDQTDSLNFLGDLLDAWATNGGKRWGVDADAQVYARTDPTAARWVLTPDSGRFGLADDDYASNLYGRYLASGAGYATASVEDTPARTKFGYKAALVDLTPLGLLTSGQALAQLNGLLAKGKARQGYTNGVEVTRYQITTPGGTPAFLPFVMAGDKVRQFGVLDEQGLPLPFLEWVIGEKSYEAGSGAITLTPVGLVARTLTDVLTLGGAA